MGMLYGLAEHCFRVPNRYLGWMVAVYIALGSNLGDRYAYLRAAVAEIAVWPRTQLVAESRCHNTDPVGGPQDQPRFLNQVIAIETALSPEEVLAKTQSLEKQAGRDAVQTRIKDGPRTLDLDILLYGDQVIDQPGLTVPHPRMGERLFVLEPLVEIAPDLLIPGQSHSVQQLVQDVMDAVNS